MSGAMCSGAAILHDLHAIIYFFAVVDIPVLSLHGHIDSICIY